VYGSQLKELCALNEKTMGKTISWIFERGSKVRKPAYHRLDVKSQI
jgi:hypothetical protein